MAVFTFVCRHKGGSWTAKQHAGDGNLEGSAATPYELQQQLRNAALQTAGPGAVSVDFSLISPSSAVLQVIVGGGGGGGAVFSSGGGAAAPAASAGVSAPAAEEPKKEEEKEESDDDMGFSLFD